MTATDPAAETAALDATGQADLVRQREISPAELVEWAIQRVERLNSALNAVVTPMFDQAVRAAKSTPSASSGDRAAPFAGVPCLLKDLIIECKGVRFTEGSVFLRDNISTYDSELVLRLQRAGLIILGKTNTPEFGMVPTAEPVLFGPTRNPWDIRRSTSGSSGGSAAAVASGMVPMAHANDVGGSIRYPASACGLFGLKPTRGRNSLGPEYGEAFGGWAVEHAVTRSVRDSAGLLDATAGPARGDPYWAPPPARPFAHEVGAEVGTLRIAFSSRMADGSEGHPDCIAALRHTVALCESLGHEMVEADLPGFTPEIGEAIGMVYNAATAWILAYWIRRRGRRPAAHEIEPLTRAFWEAGEKVTAAGYLTAVEDLQRFARRVAGFMTGIDMWLTPTMSEPPAPIGEITSIPEEPMRALERGGRTVGYAGVVANITGNPAMSLPLWWSAEGLPIGVHFLGRFGDEAGLFRLAAQLEEACPWRHRTPPVWGRAAAR